MTLTSSEVHSNVAGELRRSFNVAFVNNNEAFYRLRKVSVSWVVSAKLVEALASFYQCRQPAECHRPSIKHVCPSTFRSFRLRIRESRCQWRRKSSPGGPLGSYYYYYLFIYYLISCTFGFILLKVASNTHLIHLTYKPRLTGPFLFCYFILFYFIYL